MHSPAQAILWQIYWRCRWTFIAAGTFLALAILLSHLLPTSYKIHLGDHEVPAVGWFLGTSCLFVNVILVAAFSMHGGDVRQLDFSRHMFVLPISTRTLVTWPMLSGCVLVAAVWLIIACFVFRPGGLVVPLWFPAAALSLFLATFQAIAWAPFAQRWLHGAFAIAVLISPLFVLLIGMLLDIRLSEPAATAILIGLMPVAYVAAVAGVSRTRRGDPYEWRTWERIVERFARSQPAARRPFRSENRAQLWYECRAHLIILLFIACMLPCFIFLTALEPTNVGFGWRVLGMLLATPLLLATLTGSALGHLTDPLSKQERSTFVLVRPISNLSIIRGKLLLAAIMTGAIWILFAVYIGLLLLRPGFAQSIAGVASGVPTWKAVSYPLLTLLLLVSFTWKNMIETLWISLTGRKWVEAAVNFTFAGSVFLGFGVGLWIVFHPELHSTAIAAVPWLIGVLLLVKLAAAVLVVRRSVTARLITSRGAVLMAFSWLVLVALLCVLTFALLPAGMAETKTVLPGIALMIPFTRVVGTPLALNWNRHR